MITEENAVCKILLLGAGLVTRPLSEYLLKIPNFRLTVATRTPDKAYALIGDNPRGMAIPLDMEKEPARLHELVEESDLAISLLPPIYHPVVAEACIKCETDMLTTSYVSPKMHELDEPARKAGILILNEIGLDPGIDHMSAMRIIDHVRNSGGKITGFRSYCGGLPAPEANDNPYGYKFSWSPRRSRARGEKLGKIS